MTTNQETPQRAYNKGCMWGMGGGERHACPYTEEQLISQWLAGWRNGFAAWRKRRLTAPHEENL